MQRPALLVPVLLLCLSPTIWAADLQANITGLRSVTGEVNVALYDQEAGFPEGASRTAGVRVKAQPGTICASFTNLKPGTYAVAVYHDENSNGQLDKNLLGLPLEGYGFSNNARGNGRPPSFFQAAFPVDDTPKVITITLQY